MRIIGIVAAVSAATALSGCSGARFWERSDLVAEPAACAQQRFEIYFAEGQARLTEPAAELIDTTAAALRGCEIARVDVLGLADASGTPGRNLTLSQERARIVAEAFAAAGWPAPAFQLSAAGDAGATTAAGTQEPLRRRTEVIVHAAPHTGR